MDNSFDPKQIEQALYDGWEQAGYFAPSGNGTPYSIAIPPPNVTGTLHIGHGFQHTLMDALIRAKRMSGYQTLWQTGTDHAGISTQMVVTEQLAAEGKTLDDLGREAFVERVWQWREQSGGTITKQMRRLGSSVDWSRERFTMDEGFSHAVLEVFVRLHAEGLIYRGKRLVNWDPVLKTALSDLEVVSEDEPGHLWHFRYPLDEGVTTSDGKSYLVVATTRPETMLGDTAVAVHPTDVRYKDLIGKHVLLPLVGRRLPIIADEYVDPEFGTGCVKITPAHDFNDNEIGERHGLPLINVLTAAAAINDEAPPAYRGLDRFDARNQIVADLEELGLLDAIEDHTIKIPRGERSDQIVEPWLTDQWFVKVAPLAGPAIAAVENGEIRFEPKRFENLYFAWMRDIKDWCISRQQWWGHRIPAWYDGEGNVYVGRTEEDARASAHLDPTIELEQDPDVLETWFSSSLWTFATLGWPEETPELEKYHPTDVLVTGHDIIFFWVARMIMMTLHFMGEVPFKTVYMTGLVRDAEGRKMSKTKGNGLDPLDLIDGIGMKDLVTKRTQNLTQPRMAARIAAATRKDFPNGIPAFGTDALRFTYCALASPGRDINFDLNRIEGYRNFCNKLWNATRFVLENTESKSIDGESHPSIADRWIRSRAHELVSSTRLAIDTYRFDLYAAAVYEFAWHEYCDWYLEITKTLFFDDAAEAADVMAARRTLLEVLELLLRTAHPIMPYITETLWQRIARPLGITGPTLMLQMFPAASDMQTDPEADAAIDWLKGVVTGVRNIRGERQIKPRAQVELLLQGGDETDRDRSIVTDKLLRRLAKLSTIDWLDPNTETPPGSVQLVGALKIIVPFSDPQEAAVEQERLGKEIDRMKKDLARITGKLSNQNFVQKAPAEVVEKERIRHDELTAQLATLEQQRGALADGH